MSQSVRFTKPRAIGITRMVSLFYEKFDKIRVIPVFLCTAIGRIDQVLLKPVAEASSLDEGLDCSTHYCLLRCGSIGV